MKVFRKDTYPAFRPFSEAQWSQCISGSNVVFAMIKISEGIIDYRRLNGADLRGLHASWEDCLDRNRWRDICSGEIVLRAIDQAPTGSMRYEMRDRRRGAARVIDGGHRRIGD